MAETAPSDISIAPLNFASLSSSSSLQLVHILDWRLVDNQELGTICTSYGSWLKEERAHSCLVKE